ERHPTLQVDAAHVDEGAVERLPTQVQLSEIDANVLARGKWDIVRGPKACARAEVDAQVTARNPLEERIGEEALLDRRRVRRRKGNVQVGAQQRSFGRALNIELALEPPKPRRTGRRRRGRLWLFRGNPAELVIRIG